MSRGTFGVIGFFCIFAFYSLPFGLSSKKIRTFVRRVPTALSKLRSMCPKRSFDEQVFPYLAFFHHFRTLCELLLMIWEISFSRVVKAVFYMSRWTFQEKFNSYGKELLFFLFSGFKQKNRENCRNLIIVSRGSFRRFFGKLLRFLYFCGIQQISFRSFTENFSAGLSKLLCVFRGSSWGKRFF